MCKHRKIKKKKSLRTEGLEFNCRIKLHLISIKINLVNTELVPSQFNSESQPNLKLGFVSMQPTVAQEMLSFIIISEQNKTEAQKH